MYLGGIIDSRISNYIVNIQNYLSFIEAELHGIPPSLSGDPRDHLIQFCKAFTEKSRPSLSNDGKVEKELHRTAPLLLNQLQETQPQFDQEDNAPHVGEGIAAI